MSPRLVHSNQPGPHRDLVSIVGRHLESDWRRPVARHTADAFASVSDWLASHDGPIIFDSCCGTGESTRLLAACNPGARVLGVDKSAARLARHVPGNSKNYSVLRADVNDLWRLARNAGIRPHAHYLLYPNPWPKASQVRKRWHASPAFPAMIALGGELELRTNWAIYAEEFSIALRAVGIECEISGVDGTMPVTTAFERKYRQAGQPLYRLTATLS